MNRKIRILLVGCILTSGVAACIFLAMMRKAPARKITEELPSIKVTRIKQKTVVPELEEYGVVKSLEEAKLRAQVSGKVIYCGKSNDGEIVKKGEVIVQIEKSDYEIALNKAQAELEILKSNLKKKEATVKNVAKMLKLMQEDFDLETARFERSKKLYARKVYSRNELDSAQQIFARKNKLLVEMQNTESRETISIESIKAEIKKAKALLEQAKLNLERTTVKAPVTGRIADCDMNVGDYLNLGEEICKIINEKKPSLSVPVDATSVTNILNVVTGDKNWLELPTCIIATISWVKKPKMCFWSGSVCRIKDYDATTDTLKLLVIPEKYIGTEKYAFPLLSGMFCRIKFKGVPIKNAFKIPFSAVQFGNNVFTVDSKGVLHRHKVDIFSIEGNKAIIKTGLPEEALVVVQQLPRGVIEGMRINPALDQETTKKLAE